jgi:hypothetical protein
LPLQPHRGGLLLFQQLESTEFGPAHRHSMT